MIIRFKRIDGLSDHLDRHLIDRPVKIRLDVVREYPGHESIAQGGLVHFLFERDAAKYCDHGKGFHLSNGRQVGVIRVSDQERVSLKDFSRFRMAVRQKRYHLGCVFGHIKPDHLLVKFLRTSGRDAHRINPG